MQRSAFVMSACLELEVILYYIWMFVYFLCFQTPPKRRVLRRRNLASRRVTTSSRTSVGFCVYRYQKMTPISKKYLDVNKHFATSTSL